MQSVWGGRAALLCAGAAGLSLTGTARADEAREAALERKVAELERQLVEIRSQLGAPASGNELEQRVAELEKLTRMDKGGVFGYWKEGFRFDSADKQFTFKVNGRIMDDFVWWDSDDDVESALGEELNTGKEFRRARLEMGGLIYGNVEYKAVYDFAGGEAAFKDVFIALDTECLGVFTVGHQFEPFGLETMTSSKYISFMERSLPTIFSPDRNNGLRWDYSPMDELFVQAGVFRDSDDFGDDVGNEEQGEWNFTGRVAGRPWVNEEGDSYLHLGIAGTVRNPSDSTVRVRQRPEVHISPRFVDTRDAVTGDDILADGATAVDLEAAFVAGPFWTMAEYARMDVDAVGMSDPTFDGFTLQAGFFLTGETRPMKDGTFARVKPKRNFGTEEGSGAGAFEVALRYSSIDLDDGDVRGGELDSWTLGLNWYLNSNTRVMFNVVRASPDRDEIGLDDDVTAVMMRFQIDF